MELKREKGNVLVVHSLFVRVKANVLLVLLAFSSSKMVCWSCLCLAFILSATGIASRWDIPKFPVRKFMTPD